MSAHLSASFSATLRVKLEDIPGTFAKLATAIGEAGGSLGAIDLVRIEKGKKVRDVTVDATSSEHIENIVNAILDQGSTIYLGGTFTSPRARASAVAAFPAAATPRAFNSHVGTGAVNALAHRVPSAGAPSTLCVTVGSPSAASFAADG